jgi:hypothetical protein
MAHFATTMAFLGFIKEDLTREPPIWSVDERQTLEDVIATVGGEDMTPASDCGWTILANEPKYGALLVGKVELQTDADTVHLEVLGLDSWTFSVKLNAGGSKPIARQHTSIAGDQSATLYAGHIPVDAVPNFMIEYRKVLEAAQAKTGDARHAKNDGGHQKTPSFIYAVAQTALSRYYEKCKEGEVHDELVDKKDAALKVHPRGGLTDVGQHTGGVERDTEFPLTVVLTREILRSSEHLPGPSSMGAHLRVPYGKVLLV